MVDKEAIRRAIWKFISKDKEELLKIDIYEPTISHRIAMYLEDVILDHHDYHID